MALSRSNLEELGRQLLAEIGLEQPHIITDYLRGFVRTANGKREMMAPWPTSTREGLYVLAHEIGHWQLHTVHLGRGWWTHRDLSTLVMEYESERYAHRRLRELGVPVPRYITRLSKMNVAEKVRAELRHSTDAPDGKIARWAQVDVEKERGVEWGAAAWRMLERARRGKDDAVDILVGFLRKFPRLGTKVQVLALTQRGETWADTMPCLSALGSSVPRLRSLPVEEMVSLVTTASAAGLIVKRE